MEIHVDEKGNKRSMDWLNVSWHPVEVHLDEISNENESNENEGVEVDFTMSEVLMASKMDIQK